MSFDIQFYLNKSRSAFSVSELSRVQLNDFNHLHEFHYENSLPYRRIVREFFSDTRRFESLDSFPYITAGLFKQMTLQSIPNDRIFKTLTSSGTTSGQTSRIVIDSITSQMQKEALVSTMKQILGAQRRSMLIIDSEATLKQKNTLSARSAGILGMMNFGRDHFYALDAGLKVRREELKQWLLKNKSQPLFIFGFTFLVWSAFYELFADGEIDLSQAILIHGGGWKKLRDKSVDSLAFKASLKRRFGLSKVHDYYGMVEQMGLVYLECDAGYFHPPAFAHIFVRDPQTWKVLEKGRGLLQVMSLLPRSYPGHSILTEDEGLLGGLSGCACGESGPYFKVLGRLPKAVARGCSDTLPVAEGRQ